MSAENTEPRKNLCKDSRSSAVSTGQENGNTPDMVQPHDGDTGSSHGKAGVPNAPATCGNAGKVMPH